MKNQRTIAIALVILAQVGLGAIAVAQQPAPPAAAKPNPNPDAAAATLLAECIRKEQGSEGTTRSAAAETCKKRLTREPVSAPNPEKTPTATRPADISSETK